MSLNVEQVELQRWAEITEAAAKFGHSFIGDIKPDWYPSPINIPEGTSGKIRIRHRHETKGTKLDIVSTREALLRGQTPVKAMLPRDMIIHELSEIDQGVWMTDLPSELNQAQAAIRHTKPIGDVLVGGLGLGILPAYLSQMPVESITVIERNRDVIKLCANEDIYDVERGTIESFLKMTKRYFDAVFLDTWQGQSESTFWYQVFPLRRLVQQRFGNVMLWCWKDDEFMSQAYGSLRRPPEGEGYNHWYHKKLPLPLSHDEAMFFLTAAGMPEWEKRYADIVKT